MKISFLLVYFPWMMTEQKCLATWWHLNLLRVIPTKQPSQTKNFARHVGVEWWTPHILQDRSQMTSTGDSKTRGMEPVDNLNRMVSWFLALSNKWKPVNCDSVTIQPNYAPLIYFVLSVTGTLFQGIVLWFERETLCTESPHTLCPAQLIISWLMLS